MLGVIDMSLYTDELSQVAESNKQDNLFQLIGVHLSEAGGQRPHFPPFVCDFPGWVAIWELEYSPHSYPAFTRAN